MTDLYTAELKHDKVETVLVVTIDGVKNDVYLGSSLDDDGDVWKSIGKLWVAVPKMLEVLNHEVFLLAELAMMVDPVLTEEYMSAVYDAVAPMKENAQ